MGLDIVTNIMAQDASNALSINEANMQKSVQKLSSGYQINKAADPNLCLRQLRGLPRIPRGSVRRDC